MSQDFQTRHDQIPTSKLFIDRRHRRNGQNFDKKKLKKQKIITNSHLNRHTFRSDQVNYVKKNDLQHSQMTQALTKVSSYSLYNTVLIHNFYAILEEGTDIILCPPFLKLIFL